MPMKGKRKRGWWSRKGRGSSKIRKTLGANLVVGDLSERKPRS